MKSRKPKYHPKPKSRKFTVPTDSVWNQIKSIHSGLSTAEFAGRWISLKEQARIKHNRCCCVLSDFKIREFSKQDEVNYAYKLHLKGSDRKEKCQEVTRFNQGANIEFDWDKWKFNDELSDEEYKEFKKRYKYIRGIMWMAMKRRCKLWEKTVLDVSDQRDRYLQYVIDIVKKYSKCNDETN